MAKDTKIGVFWKLLFCTVTFLSFDSAKMAKTTCPDWYGLNYTLPMFHKCEMMRLHDGSMVQSIPKLIPFPSVIGGCHRRKSKEGIPGGHRICRIPYCDENLCNNGWCEETMVGYNCTCSSGFQGRHCNEIIIESTTEATTKPTTSPTTTMTERSDTTTSQNTTTSESVTTEPKTKSEPSPTTTMSERSDTTTSQETTTSKSVTTEAQIKSEPSPTATMAERLDATTSRETHTSSCSSPPVDCEFGGSFYNFSTSEMNHSSAVSACSEYGSHLVFIESQEEEEFIKEHGQSMWNNYWIGLTGLSRNEARWRDGSNLAYTNWKKYSFNDNVNCFRIAFGPQDSSWQDKACSTQFRFICEKEVGI